MAEENKTEIEQASQEPQGPQEGTNVTQAKHRTSEKNQLSFLIFGKYDPSEVTIKDRGLERYINLQPIMAMHIGGKYANQAFSKGKVNVVERLMNNLMRTEAHTGEKTKAYTTVKKAFEIIEKKTKKNPIQVFVDAIQNTAPREETTRLVYAGVSVPKAVDVAPQRRLNTALRLIATGTIEASYKKKKRIWECLADELINASQASMNSYAFSKREEIERVAKSAR